MTCHSKEPWSYFKNNAFTEISSEEDGEIGNTCASSCFGNEILGDANARRIVACVNALAGVPTEWLEKFSVDGSENVAQENARLTKQRDELLEALEAFSNYIHAEQCSTDGPVHYSDGQLTALAAMARKAIAKAKGGAA